MNIQVTGANENARKLLSTDLVNTNINNSNNDDNSRHRHSTMMMMMMMTAMRILMIAV